MADLRDLTTDAKRLYEALEYLVEKKEKESSKQEMDFKEIWFTAKTRPWKQHILEKKENPVRKKYLMILAASIYLSKSTEKRTMQVRFLARILAACEGMEIGIKEIITDGRMISEKSIDEFYELGDRELQIALLVDLLLMCYLTGEAEEQQSDFAIGFMAMLGLDEKTVTAIGMVVKGILETKDEIILQQSQYLDIASVYCYMKNPPDGVLVSDIEQAKTVQSKKIIFSGCSYRGLPKINCDEFAAEIIEFSGCIFTGVQGIYNSAKKLILKNCRFEDCEIQENLLTVKNSKIVNCDFKNISTQDSKYKYIFHLWKCEMDGCKFDNITVRQGRNSGGFISSWASVIQNCNINNLQCKGDKQYFSKRIVDIRDGKIFDCKFNKCKFYGGCYLLSCWDNATYNNIEVHEYYGEGWYNSGGYGAGFTSRDVFGSEVEWKLWRIN